MKGERLGEEALAGGDVAGDGTRLDEGGTLPVLADALVVVERGVGGDGEWGRARVGAQAQVGAEDVAVLGALLQQPHEVAGEAHEEVLHLQAGAQAHAPGLVEHDEIDVGGVVELEGAVLAHRQDDVARRIGRQPIAPGARLGEQEMRRSGRGSIRSLAQAARHRHHRPDAAQIAQGGEKGDVGLEEPQLAHGIGHRVLGGDRGGHLLQETGEALVGVGREGVSQGRGIAQDELGEKRRGAEDAEQKIVDLGSGQQRRQRRKGALFAAAAGQIGKRRRRARAVVHHGSGCEALVERVVGQGWSCTFAKRECCSEDRLHSLRNAGTWR